MTSPAPESRKAINVCPTHGETGNEPCAICFKPPCSEVVERLAAECLVFAYDDPKGCQFDRAKAEAILHEWRERRVQELEECLRRVVKASVDSCDFCQVCLECDEHEESCEIGKADLLLAKSDEWREQIRKGANRD